jgi:UDP-2,4-diacetamido-2,4,6-trideoxy-beta-L-altropyranose hydrolase
MSEESDGLLVLRADAGVEIGIGHVVRCLALAQAWRDRGRKAAFVFGDVAPELARRVSSEGVAIHVMDAPSGSEEDARETARIAARGGAWWVLIDGYGFGARYQEIVRAAQLRVARIVDHEPSPGPSDAVLNQNAHADASASGGSSPLALMGTRYALLRREFRPWRSWRRSIAAEGRRILVTMGGSDPDNATLEVLRCLRTLERTDLQVRVLAGPSNPHGDSLVRELPVHGGRVELCDAGTDVPELMAWADLAISGAGSTCWELAFMGVPIVAVILAENQRRIAESLVEAGAAVAAGWHRDLEATGLAQTVSRLISEARERASMSRCGRTLVDGLGADRVAEALESAVAVGRSA